MANVVQPTVHVRCWRSLLLMRLGHVVVIHDLLLPTVKATGIDAGRWRLLLLLRQCLLLLLLLWSHAYDGRRL